MSETSIERTDVTWNPVIGCSRVSEGCRNCYAETMASRLSAMGQGPYQGLTTGTGRKAKWTGVVRFLPEKLALPLRWKKPRRIFVNSMSDLFHPSVTFEQIAAIFGVMAACPQHTFQILTKRPERAWNFFEWFCNRPNLFDGWGQVPSLTNGDKVMDRWQRLATDPLPNVWLGVSIENQATADERVPVLLYCPAVVRWVSAEPLLGAVDLHNENRVHRQDYDWLTGLRYGVEDDGSPMPLLDGPRIDWVVAGGESGAGARPAHPEWFRNLRDQCVDAGVPFIFKQWGAWVGGYGARIGFIHLQNDTDGCGDKNTHEWGDGFVSQHVGKAAAGRILDGRTWDEYPEVSDV